MAAPFEEFSVCFSEDGHIVEVRFYPISQDESIKAARLHWIEYAIYGLLKLDPTPNKPMQSAMYRDSSVMERELRAIDFEHGRILALMNWKIRGIPSDKFQKCTGCGAPLVARFHDCEPEVCNRCGARNVLR